ncbi:MAG: hypothetical protein QOF97_3112, partial [Acidimicrobiaceae bacterium]
MGTDQAARAAAWLFIAAGVLTIADAQLPDTGNPTVTRISGIAAVIIGLLVRSAPWERWSQSSTLYLVAPALTLIAFGNRYG